MVVNYNILKFSMAILREIYIRSVGGKNCTINFLNTIIDQKVGAYQIVYYFLQHFYANDKKWHYAVDYICLNAFSNIEVLFEAMHDVNMCKIHIYFLLIVLVFEFFKFLLCNCLIFSF